MAADWRSRPPPYYSGSFESYYPGESGPPPSYSGGNYGTPRSGGQPTVHQHSPIVVSRSSSDFYNESPHSRSMSPGPPGYERQPPSSFSPAPYRTARAAGSAPPPHRSQVIHRGAPPYSTRGASASAVSTPRSHPPRPYGDSRGFFPDSPYSSRNRQPMGRLVMPLHRQHLPPLPRDAGPAPWEPPSPDESKQKKIRHPEDEFITATASRDEEAEGKDEEEKEGGDEDEEGGDPLALLAKVSSDMETKPGEKPKKKQAESKQASSAPPTSPLTRRTRSSPVITPTTDNTSAKRKVEIHPSFPEVPAPPRAAAAPAKGPKAVTPMPPYYPPPYGEEGPRGPPPHHYSGPPPSRNAPGYRPYPPPPQHRGMPPSWHREGELPPPNAQPAVVERHSFDSIDSTGSHESGPHRRFYGPPPTTSSGYGPPPSPRHGPPHAMAGHPPPPPGQPYPPRYMGYNGPPPPHRQSDPYGMSPYSYVQQPHMEEKTVLRRKFSWKHYPELERFLIANRDDYLEHSSKNYTAEQKQYNNWLTERLLQVADQHNYVFDPDDFNFVAIRDRIRCYYKSYVQTARKRGLELPGKAHIKKHRPTNSLDKYAEEKDKKLREEQEKRAKGEKLDDDDEDEKQGSKSVSVKKEEDSAAADVKSSEKPVDENGREEEKKEVQVEPESK